MNREQKIEAIYNKVADKTLSFWCKVLDNSWWDTWYAHIIISQYDEKIWNVIECSSWRYDRLYKCLWHMNNMWKIIWHPIYIWDVLDYIRELFKINPQIDYWKLTNKIITFWELERKPLEEQDDLCIDYLFNLIIWN